MDLVPTLSLAFGSAWVAGINLYATVATLGLLGKYAGLQLPGNLEALTDTWVIAVALVLYTIEFVADKVPYVDSLWDVVHTFIRIPAGAALAATAFGDYDLRIKTIAVLVGGTVALSSHGTKMATRAAVNLSPEPITNIAVSVIEDVFAVGALILGYFLPVALLVLVVLSFCATIVMLPRIMRLAKKIFQRRPKLQVI